MLSHVGPLVFAVSAIPCLFRSMTCQFRSFSCSLNLLDIFIWNIQIVNPSLISFSLSPPSLSLSLSLHVRIASLYPIQFFRKFLSWPAYYKNLKILSSEVNLFDPPLTGGNVLAPMCLCRNALMKMKIKLNCSRAQLFCPSSPFLSLFTPVKMSRCYLLSLSAWKLSSAAWV